MQTDIYNETFQHNFDASLRCFAEDATLSKDAYKSEHYKNFFDYCIKIADELPQRQAFYTVDFEDILWKVQEWKKHLPRVEIFYAVKANNDQILLQLFVKLGISFDCASEGEMKLVLDLGSPPKNIIYAHTIKPEEELKFASKKGVELMTFDNEEELLKIHRVFPNAKLLIRIVPTKVSCSYDLSVKFGCTENDALELLKLARQLNLNVVGISFHVGSLNTDPSSYTSTIETSRRLFDAAEDIGFTFWILDIGGGFFGASETQHIFLKMTDSINKALEKYFPQKEIRIIAEPGTYFVNSAFTLVNTVLGKRYIDNAGEDKPKRDYYLNDGVYCSFQGKFHLFGVKPIPILDKSEIDFRPKYVSRLYGQTLHNEDVIMLNVMLPELQVGERISWCNFGAYRFSLSSTFCEVPRPIPRYIFERKQRLNMDWIISNKIIADFLKKHISFIDCTGDYI